MVFILIAAFVLGMTVVAGLLLGAIELPGLLMQRKLGQRLEEVTGSVTEDEGVSPSLLKDQSARGAAAAIDRLVAGSTRGSALARW